MTDFSNDLSAFLPVIAEDLATIRNRMDADVNAGLDPSDDRFIDTTEGGAYYDLTQVTALELDRLWDSFATEMVAAMFPATAWGDYLDRHGLTVRVERLPSAPATGQVRFTGAVGIQIPLATQVSTVQVDPSLPPQAYETTVAAVIPDAGFFDVPVQALEAGAAGNQAAGTVTVLLTSILPPPAGGTLTSITNPVGMSGGVDVEEDESLRKRVLAAFAQPQGAGTMADYQRWALGVPGVGAVTVDPIWAGAGTVRVVAVDTFGNPISTALISRLQQLLDPTDTPGQGHGLAPIGAIVTVTTPTLLLVTVAATVVLAAGYTITGAGGTIGVEDAITQAVADYVNRLGPGDDVIRNHVESQFFRVPGVIDVSASTINGAAANLVVSATQIARLNPDPANDVVLS